MSNNVRNALREIAFAAQSGDDVLNRQMDSILRRNLADRECLTDLDLILELLIERVRELSHHES